MVSGDPANVTISTPALPRPKTKPKPRKAFNLDFLLQQSLAGNWRQATEHQQYSTENQGKVIRQYAERRGFTITRTYADAGKSGLSTRARWKVVRRSIRSATQGNVRNRRT
jgi:hypothetical protein